MTSRSITLPTVGDNDRTFNVLAAYEFGLNRQMFTHGLVYRHKYAWAGRDAEEMALAAHDGLSWALDVLRPMLPRFMEMSLSASLRHTRTMLDRSTSLGELKSLLRQFLRATEGTLDDAWTLTPWYRLGRAVGQCEREIVLTGGVKSNGPFRAGKVLAAALADMPADARGYNRVLKKIVKVARAADLTKDLVKLRTFIDSVETRCLPKPHIEHIPRKTKGAKQLSPSLATRRVLLRLERQRWYQLCSNAEGRNLFILDTVNKLNHLLFEQLRTLPDAPVFSFHERDDKLVRYKGIVFDVPPNCCSWLKLLDNQRGVPIGRNRAQSANKFDIAKTPFPTAFSKAPRILKSALDVSYKGRRIRHLEQTDGTPVVQGVFTNLYNYEPRPNLRIFAGWTASHSTMSSAPQS